MIIAFDTILFLLVRLTIFTQDLIEFKFFLIISCAALAEHVFDYLIVRLTYSNTLSLVIQ